MTYKILISADQRNLIGNNLRYPFYELNSLYQWFRECTRDVFLIMGRKTYDSLPNKYLKNRICIVLTNNSDKYILENYKHPVYGPIFLKSWKAVDIFCSSQPRRERVIIGGEEILKQVLGQYTKYNGDNRDLGVNITINKIILNNIKGEYYGNKYLPKLEIDKWRFKDILKEFKEFEVIEYERIQERKLVEFSMN